MKNLIQKQTELSFKLKLSNKKKKTKTKRDKTAKSTIDNKTKLFINIVKVTKQLTYK